MVLGVGTKRESKGKFIFDWEVIDCVIAYTDIVKDVEEPIVSLLI
jgi:hypothetical protein